MGPSHSSARTVRHTDFNFGMEVKRNDIQVKFVDQGHRSNFCLLINSLRFPTLKPVIFNGPIELLSFDPQHGFYTFGQTIIAQSKNLRLSYYETGSRLDCELMFTRPDKVGESSPSRQQTMLLQPVAGTKPRIKPWLFHMVPYRSSFGFAD